jgi:2-polyprenyl-3-methyl-5-hydroxy-6-metoxy-1,4-benzoquinol methylase
MEELFQCPICDTYKLSHYLNCLDYTVSNESFNIVSCDQCGHKFTNPRPEPGKIEKYYESESYVSHSDTKAGLINKIYHTVRKAAIRSKINLLNTLSVTERKVLDIGSGTGAFLGAAKTEGYEVAGIEPNEKARQSAYENYSIKTFAEDHLQSISKDSIPIITMWHVLEHVHNLKSRVQEIAQILKPGGYAIIAVPNHISADAAHYKEFWAAFDVPRHLHHFSPATIKNLFLKSGLNHIKSLPMKFDSFYVSLLSEKYKKSSLQYARAFTYGFLSNMKAKKDAEKYSSVIYIFQKK